MRLDYSPVTPAPLTVGQRVRVDGHRFTWAVQAVSEHFVVLVQHVPNQSKGALQYTVVDWRGGRRGPCNLIGQGFGDGSYSPEECARMLARFELPWDAEDALEVSHRNNMPVAADSIVVVS